MWNFSVVPRRISIRLNAEDKWALSTQFLKKKKKTYCQLSLESSHISHSNSWIFILRHVSYTG